MAAMDFSTFSIMDDSEVPAFRGSSFVGKGMDEDEDARPPRRLGGGGLVEGDEDFFCLDFGFCLVFPRLPPSLSL